jgi:hypothetical protein
MMQHKKMENICQKLTHNIPNGHKLKQMALKIPNGFKIYQNVFIPRT